jgi:hypothetical protein
MFSKPLPPFRHRQETDERRDGVLFQYPHSVPQTWLRDLE